MSSDLTLWEKKKKEKMREMMYAARDLFEKKGYDNTSVKEICDEAVISRATFFNYFGSKDGLIKALMQDDIEVLQETTEDEFSRTDDPVGAFVMAVDMILEAILDFPECGRVSTQYTLLDEGFIDEKNGYLSVMDRFLAIAYERGIFRDDLTEEEVLFIMKGCYYNAILDSSIEDKAERRAYTKRILLEVIEKLKRQILD